MNSYQTAIHQGFPMSSCHLNAWSRTSAARWGQVTMKWTRLNWLNLWCFGDSPTKKETSINLYFMILISLFSTWRIIPWMGTCQGYQPLSGMILEVFRFGAWKCWGKLPFHRLAHHQCSFKNHAIWWVIIAFPHFQRH